MEVSMQNRYIMTAFGKDRPGIVADVTGVLYENGCNLEDTTMSMLSDEFTLNLLFSSNDDTVETTLTEACLNLERQKKISAFIRPLHGQRRPPSGNTPMCTIHVEGMDQAGIVHKISQFLSDNALNIVDLKSTVKVTPESGTALYLMDIHIQLTGNSSKETVEEGLNTVAEELNVEISVNL
jgi:glycine cleavage system transcriptional repressor